MSLEGEVTFRAGGELSPGALARVTYTTLALRFPALSHAWTKMVSVPTERETVVVQGELVNFNAPMTMWSKPLPESVATALTRMLPVPLGTLVSLEGDEIFKAGGTVSSIAFARVTTTFSELPLPFLLATWTTMEIGCPVGGTGTSAAHVESVSLRGTTFPNLMLAVSSATRSVIL